MPVLDRGLLAVHRPVGSPQWTVGSTQACWQSSEPVVSEAAEASSPIEFSLDYSMSMVTDAQTVKESRAGTERSHPSNESQAFSGGLFQNVMNNISDQTKEIDEKLGLKILCFVIFVRFCVGKSISEFQNLVAQGWKS